MPPLKRKREDKNPVQNPLRDKELLVAASRAQAALLSSASVEKSTTAIGFCRDVLREQLGLQDFAIGQWERMVAAKSAYTLYMQCPELKCRMRVDHFFRTKGGPSLCRFQGDADGTHIVKPPTAAPVHLPSLAECAQALNTVPSSGASAQARVLVPGDGSSATTKSHVIPRGGAVAPKRRLVSSSDLRARLSAGLDPIALQKNGAVLIPSVLGAEEVAAVAAKLAEKNTCGAEICLRASTGNGVGGAYQTIQLPAVPVLCELSNMLAETVCERLNTPTCGSKALVLRYARGGVNWAHQDQSACPFQAVLLLSRPTIDFNGGQFYVTDVVGARTGDAGEGTGAVCQIEWQGSGDVIVFAANGNGSNRYLATHTQCNVRN